MRRFLVPWLTATSLAALAVLAHPASAELAVGAEAVDVEARAHINIEPVKLSELKGRLILLELFSTT